MNQKRILIVEDESIIRMDLKKMLLSEGYTVIKEANNGEKAIEYAFNYKPDLILMDIKIPKLNGLKASKIIGKNFEIPIIIITAYSQKEFIENAQQDNIVGYLVKPIDKKELIPAIEIALHQAEKTKKLRRDIENAKQELEYRKIIERAKGVLMDTKSFSEQEAYNFLRRASMSKRIPMYVLSKSIIETYAKVVTK